MASAKITLTQEKETLFVPLLSKARESQRPTPILHDPTAEAIVAQIDYPLERLSVPIQSQLTLAMRAKRFDQYTQAFAARYPQITVLHLGCGLDSRVVRTNLTNALWYDLDYPEVIAIRREFYPARPNYTMIGASITDHTWMQQVDSARPTLIIAEGVLMYIGEPAIQALLGALVARFRTAELIFDAFSRATQQRIQRHPSIQRTNAQVLWGLDTPRLLEEWADGVRFVEEWAFTQSADIAKLRWPFRVAFGLANWFPAARQAHRVLRYQWGMV